LEPVEFGKGCEINMNNGFEELVSDVSLFMEALKVIVFVI